MVLSPRKPDSAGASSSPYARTTPTPRRPALSVQDVYVEVSKKNCPTGQRMTLRHYPTDNGPRTLRITRELNSAVQARITSMGIGLDLAVRQPGCNPSPDPPSAPASGSPRLHCHGLASPYDRSDIRRRGVIAEINLEDDKRPVSPSKCLSQRMDNPARRS